MFSIAHGTESVLYLGVIVDCILCKQPVSDVQDYLCEDCATELVPARTFDREDALEGWD